MQALSSTLQRIFTAILLVFLLLSSTACEPEFEGRPTAKPTQISSITRTVTITLTPTPPPTVTPSPIPTLTFTPTLAPTATPTKTATPIPTRVSTLFPMTAGGYQTVDWNYFYISRQETREDSSLLSLSAMVAFQLLDRGIHSETLKILDQNVTVYYLRVSHTYNQTPIETRLVLTGTFGKDVPIASMSADGSAYISLRSQNSDQVFEPWNIHQDWLLPYDQRKNLFQSVLLTDFQEMLADLPDKVILLAHHPVIWNPNERTQIKLDMTRVSAQAARLEPFFVYDPYNILLGQSTNADAWRFYLLNKQDIPADIAEGNLSFSAEYLVIIIP
ncbi:MAG: hypothetical protein AB2L21_02770 [Anaerolineaceae bacterium]